MFFDIDWCLPCTHGYSVAITLWTYTVFLPTRNRHLEKTFLDRHISMLIYRCCFYGHTWYTWNPWWCFYISTIWNKGVYANTKTFIFVEAQVSRILESDSRYIYLQTIDVLQVRFWTRKGLKHWFKKERNNTLVLGREEVWCKIYIHMNWAWLCSKRK